MSGSNLNMLLDTFTVELHKLNDWLLNNKLVIYILIKLNLCYLQK